MYVCICMYVCMYVCINIHIFIYVYIAICIYIKSLILLKSSTQTSPYLTFPQNQQLPFVFRVKSKLRCVTCFL